MDQTELLWACLNAGLIHDVKDINPECIDWSRHNERGYTVIVQCVNLLLIMEHESHDRVFDCIRLCISSGANPWQKCSESASETCFVHPPEGTEITVKSAGRSAISYVETWIKQLTESALSHLGDERLHSDLKEMVNTFRRALKCFVAAMQKEHARVSIHEGIAELWERFLAAKSSHDLTFKTVDGEVTAHAQMLKEASSVISAMLASPMKEGQAQTIEVKDASSSSVSLFLEILYTCSAQTKPDYNTALQALDLAHRWQVQVAVTILSNLLGGMITDESFGAIAEQAALKGLESLKRASQSFAATGFCLELLVIFRFSSFFPRFF